MRFRSFARLHLFVLSAVVHLARATFVVRSGDQSLSFETAKFLYYGPQSRVLLDQECIFIPSSKICPPLEASTRWRYDVAGLVVIMDVGEATCTLDEIYTHLEEKDALALVVIEKFAKPGYLTFTHETRRQQHPMVMVASARIEQHHVIEWQMSTAGVRVDIIPNHNDEFQNVLESNGWLFVLRMFLPLACLIVAGIAAYRVLLQATSDPPDINFGFFVCAAEGISLLLTAVFLACGLYGPMSLPFEWNFVAYLQFLEATQCVNFFLSLAAKEKTRVILQNLPPRSLKVAYPKTVLAASLVFLFLGPPALILARIEQSFPVDIRFSSACLFQLCVTAHFYACAKDLRIPLSQFLKNGAAEIGSHNATIIGRLVRWLDILAVLLGLLCISFFVSMQLFLDLEGDKYVTEDPWMWFLGWSIFTFLRCSVSYAHLVITRPATPTMFEAAADFFRVRVYGQRVAPASSQGSSFRVEGGPRLFSDRESSDTMARNSSRGGANRSGLDLVSDITDREYTSGVIRTESGVSGMSSGISSPLETGAPRGNGSLGALSLGALNAARAGAVEPVPRVAPPPATQQFGGLDIINGLYEQPTDSFMENETEEASDEGEEDDEMDEGSIMTGTTSVTEI
eukprot:CAMPEP_0172588052 /NCGR_PEP_ID=MMETSP1068-20121228/7005_1 /TAXON_ID=35684 /ORGANISM="Pseudopedinella elastica, Strain CCMP716" /LENGTH=625 /DNA_ID=CAMNT_0013383265 /DNA_START=56 /DNA_END=1933 /DNA_ORIENTATION=-